MKLSEIMQVAWERLHREGRIVPGEEAVEPHTLMTQFHREAEGFAPRSTDVAVVERPPIRTLGLDGLHGLNGRSAGPASA